MAPNKKNQKMSLGAFLGDPSLGSWADEMDDMPMPSSDSRSGYGHDRRDFSSKSGFGGDREFGDRSFSHREQLPLPSRPPFTAHLGNLSFDVTQADVQGFFQGCAVSSVRIVEDRIDHKPKGFGYVEFGTLDGLKKALELNGTQFQGRNVRISVAEPPKERQETRELNDWTRKGPLPDLPQNQQRRASERGGYRSFDVGSESGGDRLGMERGGSRRGPPLSAGPDSDGKQRDFNNWERKGPLSPTTGPAGGPPRDGGRPRGNHEKSFDRKLSPSWGEGRSQDGSRPPRREFQERQERPERPAPERQPTAAELDNQWRARMKPDTPTPAPAPTPKSPVAATPDISTPSSPAANVPAAPAVRPKLNLQKRTVSETPEAASNPSATDSKASPFGAARPIDTAAREREIEEKLATQRKQREEEERVRKAKEQADKSEKEKPAKPERSDRPERAAGAVGVAAAPSDNSTRAVSVAKDGSSSKENGSAVVEPGKRYSILAARQENGEDEDIDEEAPDAPANGKIVDDKNVKPQEIVQGPNATTTAEDLEGEGWNTVPAKSKGNRRGGNNQTARAIAS